MNIYDVSDGCFDGEIVAENDADALKAAKAWLAGVACDVEADWSDLQEGDEGSISAGVSKSINDDGDFDDDDYCVVGEVTIKVRRVGGLIVAVE
jgi:hypothetical protein